MTGEANKEQGCADKCYGFTNLFVYGGGECYCEYSVDENGDCENEQEVQLMEDAPSGPPFNLYKLTSPPVTAFKIEERKYVLIIYMPFDRSFNRFGTELQRKRNCFFLVLHQMSNVTFSCLRTRDEVGEGLSLPR